MSVTVHTTITIVFIYYNLTIPCQSIRQVGGRSNVISFGVYILVVTVCGLVVISEDIVGRSDVRSLVHSLRRNGYVVGSEACFRCWSIPYQYGGVAAESYCAYALILPFSTIFLAKALHTVELLHGIGTCCDRRTGSEGITSTIYSLIDFYVDAVPVHAAGCGYYIREVTMLTHRCLSMSGIV